MTVDNGYVYTYSAEEGTRRWWGRKQRHLAGGLVEQYPATPSGTWTVRLKELGPQRYSSCAMSANTSAIIVGTWGSYVYTLQVRFLSLSFGTKIMEYIKRY